MSTLLRLAHVLRLLAAGLAALIATAIGLVSLALVVVLALVQTPDGREMLARGLEGLLAGEDGTGVHIRGIGAGLPARLQVERIEVVDAAGTWLAIDDLRLAWRPAALLAGRLRIEELSARAVDVARPPASTDEPTPAEPPAPPHLPRLPLGVRVDRLGVGELRLGESIAGRPMRLGIDGRLAAADPGRGGLIRTALSVVPLDGGSGAILLDADLDPASSNLALRASIDEPEGGLVGGLLGLAPRAPLVARLVGDGPLQRWQGNLDASAGGVGKLALALTLRWSDEIGLTAAGKADLEPSPLPQLAPALANGVRLEVAVRQTAHGALAVDALEVAGEAMQLSGRGTLDRDGALAFTADASLAEAALAAGTLGPLRFSSLAAHAVASGTMQAPMLRTTATVDEVVAPGARGERLEIEARAGLAPPDAEPDAAGGRVEVNGVLAGLVVDQPALRAALGNAPRFGLVGGIDAARTRASLRSLTLEGRAVRLAGSGSLSLQDHRLGGSADLRLDDLRPVAAATSSPASGGAILSVTVGGTVQPLTLSGRVSAAGNGLVTGVAAVDALLGPAPRLDAPFAWDERAGLDVSALRIDGRNVAGEGRLRLPPGEGPLDAQLSLAVPTLTPLSDTAGTPLRGRLTLDAEARGAVADPQASVVLRLQDAAVNTTRITAAKAELRAITLISRPTGRLTLDGTSDLGPLSATTDFILEGNRRLRLTPITARGLGIAVDGNVQADLAGPLASGQLHIASEDRGIRFGETALHGPLGLDVRLLPQRAQQRVAVAVRGGPLSLRQGAVEQLAIDGLIGDATIDDAFADPHVSARLRAQRISGPVAVNEMRLTVDGTPARARLTVAGEGEGERPSHLDAAADLSRMADALQLDIDRLSGRLAGEPLRLSRPARITSSPGLLEVEGLALAISSGSLSADARLGRGETNATLRAAALPLPMARAFAPAAPSHGTLAADLTLRSERADTVGDGRIALRGVGFDQTAQATGDARFDADLGLRLGGGRLTADGTIAGPEGSRLGLAGGLPVRLPAGTTAPIVDRGGPIDGRLAINADLGKLSRLLALHDQRLEGRLRGDLAVTGALADPALSGGIDLGDGLYENFVSGTLLSGLAARIEPRERRALTFRLNGNDGGEGKVSADGEAALDAAGSIDARLALHAANATLVRRDDVTATLDADIAYTAEEGPPRLAGRIESREIVVRLVDRLPPTVIELPVKEIGRPRYWRPEPEGEAAAAVAIALDLAVSLPRRVFVRGRGLESEWSGNLAITGTSNAPQVEGQVELVRGTFSFASKRFTLQRGTVTFAGGTKIDPFINTQAEYQSSDITAYIALTGLASQPEITISSQPPLPESEVLSHVLFGKSSAKLGPVEAVQLAAALDALARGESTGENALGFVRTLLGLDTLTVQPSRSGEGSSVAAGTYVGDRVYIGAERGVTDESQTGSVEIEIAPGISIQSEIGQTVTSGTQGALGLKWKLDY